MLGPGPPRGWKADELLQKLKKSDTGDSFDKPQTPVTPELPESPELHLKTSSSQQPSLPQTQPSTRPSSTESEESILDHSDDKSNASQKRPSMDRRLSIAMENIKDSLRATLHPDTWNWKRYDREDEVLWGFGERMTRMWNRAVRPESGDDQENEGPDGSPRRRKRALTNESDRYDYHRARNPALNELHPPVVSQLPATRDQAAWMMLPPPSAAVMAGKKRPGTEIEMRWPLAVIGKPPKSSDWSRPVLATTYSREALNHDEDTGLSDIDLEDTSVRDFFADEPTAQDRPSTKFKHMSDPIIRPPATYAKEPFYDDTIVPKRRGSWHIHYYYHSDQ